MTPKTTFLGLTCLICCQVFGQDFTGYVKNDDSISTAIFQATIQVSKVGVVIYNIKTSADGTFKIVVPKDHTYGINISFPGYTDTSYSITCNRNGILMPSSVVVKLKRDGMRLLGSVKDANDNFRLTRVTVILKNVMTRQEVRETTGADGRFHFKLDYETNYRISVDKRSAGIFNKYKDTTFYISTVGFNQPLDYYLDIGLQPDLTQYVEMPEGYNSSKVMGNEPVKPLIRVKSNPVYNPSPKKTMEAQMPRAMQEYSIAKQGPLTTDSERRKILQDSIAAVRAENKRIAQAIVRERLLKDSIANLEKLVHLK